MLKKLKVALLLAMAFVFALQGVGMETAQAAPGDWKAQDVTVANMLTYMGDATSYGVVAIDYWQKGHSEANVFVDNLAYPGIPPILASNYTNVSDSKSPLSAMVTLPEVHFADEMTFGLYTKEGDTYVPLNIEETVPVKGKSEVLVDFGAITNMNALGKELYVLQVENDTPVLNGAENTEGLKVTYGPSVKANGSSVAYIGSIDEESLTADMVKLFQDHGTVMQGFYNGLTLGSDLALYRSPDAENPLPDGDGPAEKVYIRDVDWVDGKYYEFGALSYDGTDFWVYPGTPDAHKISITCLNKNNSAEELLGKMTTLSEKLANSELGIGGQAVSLGTIPSAEGNSTVKGEMASDGTVVSLYAMETVVDGNMIKLDPQSIYPADADHSQPSLLNAQGLPLAENEYAVINVVVPAPAGGEDNRTLVLHDAHLRLVNSDGSKDKADADHWRAGNASNYGRVIWNPVYLGSDGNYHPYTGTVLAGQNHGGMVLVPEGKTISYTTTEAATLVAQYVECHDEVHQGSFQANNTFVKMVGETVDVKGEKKWAGDAGNEGARPDKITLTLWAQVPEVGKVKVDTITLPILENKPDGTVTEKWNWEIKGLPKEANGANIEYSIEEDKFSYYEESYGDPVYEGAPKDKPDEYKKVKLDVTNTYDENLIVVKGEKVWEDDNDRDGIRPDEITVKLQARAKWRWKYAQSFGYNPWNEQFWSWPASDEEGWADYGSFGYLNIPEDVVDELKVSADDDWKWSFGELQNKTMPQMWYYPSYGQPMYLQYEIDWQFRVVEEQVEGYETTIEGSSGTSYTITNAHESDTIDLTGKKIWWPENYNNKSEVTVKLFKNGEDTGRTAVANEKNGWQWIFTDLDKKENGEDITYTVEEQNAPNGFWVEYVKNQDGSIDIINSKKEVRLKGQKIWKDQNGNNFSPNNVPIEIKIYRDNGTGNKADDTLMATETRWDWSIELPGYAPDGSDAKYYVEESPVPNYTADVQPGATGEEHGFKIYNWTVTNTLKTIEMSVEKVWDDLDPALRPTKLRFTLYQDGVEYRDNYGTKWVEYDVVNPPSEPIKFSGLLEFRPDGTPYEYSIKEEYWFVGPYNQYYMDKWPGYVSSGESGEVVDGKFVYTLTNTQETVDLGGTKNWSGYGYGGHPTEVTLKVLYQKGEEWVEYAQEKITGAGNAASWSWTISNLPKYIDGQEVAYTVQEEYITGYVPEVSGSMTEGFTINNTAVQEIDITVAKKWVDGDNPNRPASVQVRLVRDNTPMTGARYTLELKADNNWTATFENLPVGEMRGDWWNRVYHAFTYDVQEVAVPDGYEVEISGDAGNGFEVKNTMTNFTGTLALRKTDDAGAALGGAVFTVYSDEACQTVKGTMEQGADGVHTLADLEPGDYWVKETTVPGGYTAEETVYPVTVIANQITDVVTNAAVAEATSATAIVNTKLQGEGELTISKTLTNAAKLFQEQTFTFTLYKYDNYQTGDAVGTASVSYTANAGSENTTAMLKFPLEFGAHTYLLVEETDDNAALVYDGTQYEITVKTKAEDGKLVAESITMIHQDGSAADELSFINTFNNETSITVTKAWNDDNNAANARPESITVNLMNGAQVVDTVVLSQDGQWTYTFADLPKQDANGNISYSVQEVEVGNYISVIGGNAQDGFTITNTYNVTEVKVEKKWDRVAEEEQVPVTVELVRNGSGTGETIELNAENEWKGSFTGLEKFDDNDNAYTYSVTEIDPDDFVASYTGNAQDGYIITNAIVRDGSEYYFYKASKENNVTTALKGAEFTLYSDAACTDVITKAVSDENGRVSIFIPDQYTQNGALVYLKETKAPSGYEPIEGTFSFNANKNDTPTSIPWIFQNVNPAPEIDWGFNSGALINKKLEQQEGGFKFTKRNVTGDALPGAVFGVYSDEACTAKLNELTTDEYGEASLTGLEAGKTYYIKEITAPTGYELNGTVYSVTIEAGVDDKLVGDNGVIINERNTIDLCVYKNWHNAEGNIENDTLGVNVSGALELYILSANGDQTLVKGTDGNALQPEFEDGKGENVPDLYWWRNMPILSEGEQYIVKENLSKVPAGVVVHYNSDPEGTKGYETSDSGDFSIYNSYFQGFEVFVANKKVDGQYVEDTFAFELRDAKTGEVVAKKDSVFGPDMTGIFDPDNPPPEEEWVNQVLLTVNYDEEDLPEKVGGLTEYEYILREVDAGGDYIYDTAEYEYKVTIDRMGKTRMFIKVNGEYQPFTLSHDEPVFENKAAVSISGTKVWDDNNNAGGTRPEEITIRLYADGEETDKSVTLKSGETEWSFTGLPKYAADGREIIYTADESDVPKGYVKTVTGDAASGFVITNTLKQGEGALDFTKYLTFSDYTLIPKEGYTFTFTLTPDANTPDAYTLVDNAELAEDVTSITPVVEDGKVVSYTLARKLYSRDVVNMMQVWSTLKITFTEPGTYTFTLQEKAPNPTPEGWYYDTKPHPIQFVVTEGETELEVENKNDRPPEIYNELKKKEITIYKSWNDSGYEEDRLDTTELLEYLNAWYSTDNGATWKDYGKLADLQTEEENSVVVEDWGSGLWYVNVKDLPFYIGGKEVQWSIVEKLPEGSHYETVYGDPNGFDVTAGLTGTDANNTTIFNIHEVEMTFEGTKTMTGRALTEKDIFTFEITEDGTSNSWTAQNDAKGKINFPTFTYGLSDIGLHKYTVKETSASANGIKTDEQVYELCVTVAVEYGALTLTYDADCVSVDFTNAYEAKGEITFEGTKTIEGREWREDDIYSFEVCEEGSYTAVANNDLTGKINYPTITYTQDDVGEHVYTIREISDGGNGITVDDNVYTVTVEVADNGDGSLTVTATENATELDFTNTYETKGSIQFSGVKTLDGKDLAGDDFSFQLIGEDGNVIETVKNDADGKIAFSAIEYDQNDAGKTFTYTVKEVNDEQPGIIYDQRLYTVTVTVVDDGYGTLTVIPNISESNMNFTNTYEAVGEITFSGTKTLEGRDMTDFDVFTFSIMEGENEIATVTNDAEGNIVFPAIKYHLEDVGEYTYTIREISEDGNGITVDDTVYTVTVEVADNGDGTLDVTADLDETALNFVNTYAADGSVQFSGSKTLTGKALAAEEFSFQLLDSENEVIETVKNGADGKFAFSEIAYTLDDVGTHTYTMQEVNDEQPGIGYDPTIYTITVIVQDNGDGTLYVTADLDETVLKFTNTYEAVGEITFAGVKTIEGRALTENDVFVFAVKEGEKTIVTASNDADGNIVFPTIEYTLDDVGTHTYTVKETSPSGLGITADPTEYTVTVEVADNGDGTLAVEATGADHTKLDFTNTYEAEGEIVFSGVKTIEGRALTANDKFTFEIKEGEKTIATVTNDADGKIAYPTIEYTLADVGTHTYTVKETSTDGNGITVDTTEYTVVVTVIDGGHGKLDAMADVDHTALNFTNTYEAKGEIVLEGAKTLVGRELAAGEFEFELIDEAGDVVATATNDAEGKITFTKLTYDTADIGKTYTYTAKEITGSLPGVIYDAAPITVKVAIADNGDGTLKVTKTVDSADIAFTNTYSAEGAILLAGTKSLSGRALAAGEFSFELYDANGNLLQTVTNDAKGA
ncbi:MAG: Cna B-type domain-containing protein, partial [Clostridia bacterium]|nr:Cna B-type domain-containing protein [Clostridia bacterium]